MANIVGTVEVILNKQWISSNSFTKTGIPVLKGRGASIFRISISYSINP